MHAGDCSNPAYLANVCVAKAAQRQGVGRELIHCAVDLANKWGACCPTPHLMLHKEVPCCLSKGQLTLANQWSSGPAQV